MELSRLISFVNIHVVEVPLIRTSQDPQDVFGTSAIYYCSEKKLYYNKLGSQLMFVRAAC